MVRAWRVGPRLGTDGLTKNDWENLNSLVNRSKCHLLAGNLADALKDAEMTLAGEGNGEFMKGMLQKAEVRQFET